MHDMEFMKGMYICYFLISNILSIFVHNPTTFLSRESKVAKRNNVFLCAMYCVFFFLRSYLDLFCLKGNF